MSISRIERSPRNRNIEKFGASIIVVALLLLLLLFSIELSRYFHWLSVFEYALTSGNESSIAIAIVGLSCRFPGDASSPSEFWELLKNGWNGFSSATDRYNAETFYHPTGNGNRQNVVPTKGGYFLKQDPYVFDAAFFNITAVEAMALDPRQRIALEVVYEALENAGMPPQKVADT